MEEQFEMDEEQEDSPILDALCELLNRLPKNYVLILNVQRYFEVLGVINDIVSSLNRLTPEDLSIDLRFDGLTGTSLCLEIKDYTLEVSNRPLFAEALKKVSTFGIDAQIDGMVVLGFTFEDVRFPAKMK